MVINRLDSIEFKLNELHDFTWLKRYGTAFSVVDQTGSGCVCIGMQDGEKRYFCKIAGAGTVTAEVSPQESIALLKEAVHLYYALEHPNLIHIIEEYDQDPFYVVVFEWADGDCLFDHWNFEKYQNDPTLISPKERFKKLPALKKLKAVEVLFSFLTNVNRQGYVAVDFYDGSMLYDFARDRMTLCDIDLFLKAPVTNTMGTDWYGTKRLKAPEEYVEGSVIDEQTNLFTLGAILFDFFGSYTEEEIQKRYTNNQFLPCSLENWQLNEASYLVAKKAVNPVKSERYQSFDVFYQEWRKAYDENDS